MDNVQNKKHPFDLVTQFALPILTIAAQIAVALKLPQFGLIIILASQPFWFYASWKAHKEAGQSGILITTLIYTLVTVAGIINYWFL